MKRLTENGLNDMPLEPDPRLGYTSSFLLKYANAPETVLSATICGDIVLAHGMIPEERAQKTRAVQEATDARTFGQITDLIGFELTDQLIRAIGLPNLVRLVNAGIDVVTFLEITGTSGITFVAKLVDAGHDLQTLGEIINILQTNQQLYEQKIALLEELLRSVEAHETEGYTKRKKQHLRGAAIRLLECVETSDGLNQINRLLKTLERLWRDPRLMLYATRLPFVNYLSEMFRRMGRVEERCWKTCAFEIERRQVQIDEKFVATCWTADPNDRNGVRQIEHGKMQPVYSDRYYLVFQKNPPANFAKRVLAILTALTLSFSAATITTTYFAGYPPPWRLFSSQEKTFNRFKLRCEDDPGLRRTLGTEGDNLGDPLIGLLISDTLVSERAAWLCAEQLYRNLPRQK